MPLINTDALVEYCLWVVIVYILPTFVSSALITTVLNSERARKISKGGIQVINLKINEWIGVLEGIETFSRKRDE